MPGVTVQADITLDEPYLIEGFPGVGLAGKIATDHIIDRLDLTYYGSIDSEGLPRIALFDKDAHDVHAPVRLFADEAGELVVLQSEVLVSPVYAGDLIDFVTDWMQDNSVTPVLTNGLPDDVDDQSVYGVATGDMQEALEQAGIAAPPDSGFLGGPTGALLHRAAELGMDAAGLIVETDPQFPDPAAARTLVDHGLEPLVGFDVPTEALVERAAEIREQKEQLAEMIREAEQHEASRAVPEEWYG